MFQEVVVSTKGLLEEFLNELGPEEVFNICKFMNIMNNVHSHPSPFEV